MICGPNKQIFGFCYKRHSTKIDNTLYRLQANILFKMGIKHIHHQSSGSP